MSWLLNVVVDVAKEDEADPATDHDTVLEVVTVEGLFRVGGLRQRTPFPNVHELLTQSVEEVQSVA